MLTQDRRCRAWTGAPILEGIEFVTVQKPVSEADQAFLRGFPQVREVSAQLADFADTAALLANLDLLVSVDTSVVHLAGALGVACWVLVPRPADWRWLHGREESPWYPSLRLFRQERPQEWGAVVERVVAALGREAG